MVSTSDEKKLADAVAELKRDPLGPRILRVMSRTVGTASEFAELLGVGEQAVFTVLEELATKGLLNKDDLPSSQPLFSPRIVGFLALRVVDRRG